MLEAALRAGAHCGSHTFKSGDWGSRPMSDDEIRKCLVGPPPWRDFILFVVGNLGHVLHHTLIDAHPGSQSPSFEDWDLDMATAADIDQVPSRTVKVPSWSLP